MAMKMITIMITFHFWSIQSITITQKTVIDCNRLRLMITPCLLWSRHIYIGVILHTHPVHGESHIQCNANQ